MGIINSNRTIGNITTIACQGSLEVTMAFTAAPGILNNPTDIVLILDRSGSMNGQPLADMKVAAEKFIDTIASATAGNADAIGSGSRIAIISFSSTAKQETSLTTSVTALKTAINGMSAGGLTNHGDAFMQAVSLLSASTQNKVIVMFTDGETTTGPEPAGIAAAARASGIDINCIGLVGLSGIDVTALNDWATDPDAAHVFLAAHSTHLEDIFIALAENIAKPGATGIVIDETTHPDFTIIDQPIASTGVVSQLTDHGFRWSIDELGITATETATLRYTIQHTGVTGGTKIISQSTMFDDNEGNLLTFNAPSVFVDCIKRVTANDCPRSVDVGIGGCESTVVFDAGDVLLEDTGRILQMDINLLNVCPQKRIALAVILTEDDQYGIPHPRGLKTFTIPAHTLADCTDILVTCIRFILPDSTEGTTLCAERNLKAQIFAHYIDHSFQCCNDII